MMRSDGPQVLLPAPSQEIATGFRRSRLSGDEHLSQFNLREVPTHATQRSDMVQEFFTVAEIAGLLKLSQRMIRNSIKAKKLKAVRFGRAVRVPADSLSRWMTEEDR